MTPGLALVLVLGGGALTFALALLSVWASDRLDQRDKRRREAEVRRIVREELDR